MEECFAFAVNEHSHKRMVGTRQILSESGEKQDNGKVFVKWEMGDYRYSHVYNLDAFSLLPAIPNLLFMLGYCFLFLHARPKN